MEQLQYSVETHQQQYQQHQHQQQQQQQPMVPTLQEVLTKKITALTQAITELTQTVTVRYNSFKQRYNMSEDNNAIIETLSTYDLLHIVSFLPLEVSTHHKHTHNATNMSITTQT